MQYGKTKPLGCGLAIDPPSSRGFGASARTWLPYALAGFHLAIPSCYAAVQRDEGEQGTGKALHDRTPGQNVEIWPHSNGRLPINKFSCSPACAPAFRRCLRYLMPAITAVLPLRPPLILPLWTPPNRDPEPKSRRRSTTSPGRPDTIESNALDPVQNGFSHTRHLIDDVCKDPERPEPLHTPTTACRLRTTLLSGGSAADSAGFLVGLQSPLSHGCGLDTVAARGSEIVGRQCCGIERKVPRCIHTALGCRIRKAERKVSGIGEKRTWQPQRASLREGWTRFLSGQESKRGSIHAGDALYC